MEGETLPPKLFHWGPPLKLGVFEAMRKGIEVSELNGDQKLSRDVWNGNYALTCWLIFQIWGKYLLTFSGTPCVR